MLCEWDNSPREDWLIAWDALSLRELFFCFSFYLNTKFSVTYPFKNFHFTDLFLYLQNLNSIWSHFKLTAE